MVRLGILVISGALFWFYFFILSNATEGTIKEYNNIKNNKQDYNPNNNVNYNSSNNINYNTSNNNREVNNDTNFTNGQFKSNEEEYNIFCGNKVETDLTKNDFDIEEITSGFSLDDEFDDDPNIGKTF